MHEDFYTSLDRHGKDTVHLQKVAGSSKFLPIFEHLYLKNFVQAPFQNPSCYLIPKKIHQIWLGDKMPGKSCVETWAAAAGWEYRLWTDSDVEKMRLHNSALYQLGKNFGEKSDILRLEILFREGGLYADVDVACLNIDFFDHLHRTLTFYAGFEPLEHRWLGVSNAMMGSAPGHPLLRKMLLDLKPHFFAHEHKWAVVKTGPKFVTTVLESYVQEPAISKICVFPSSYFSPASGRDIKQDNYPIFKESAALHYWSGSWMGL